MKLTPRQIKNYLDQWRQIGAALPPVNNQKIQKQFGRHIILNAMGGGCRCWQSYGKSMGLNMIGVRVSHCYGASAGTCAGLAYLDIRTCEARILKFAHLANRNKKNFYPSRLIKKVSAFPHHNMVRKALAIRHDHEEEIPDIQIPVTALLTRQWRRYPRTAYFFSVLAFLMQYGLARRTPFIRHFNRLFYDDYGRGKHLRVASWLGLFPTTLTHHDHHQTADPADFGVAAMALWPFFPFYHDGQTYHSDGSMLANNCFPFILEQHDKIDTLITLVPEPAHGYHDRYLGVAGYEKKQRLAEYIYLYTKPRYKKFPKRHIIWDMGPPKLNIVDYTNPQMILEEFTKGFRETENFIDAFDLRKVSSKRTPS